MATLFPFTVTAPLSMSFTAAERDKASRLEARNASSRIFLFSSAAISRIGSIFLLPVSGGNKAAGCVVLQDADKTALIKALGFAFYGSVDPASYELPLVVDVKFMLDDVEYSLTRALVREESGAVSEKVALSDLNTGVIYGEGKEDIDAYLLSKVGLDKEAFEKLLVIDEDYTAPIGEATAIRESFVAEQIKGRCVQ